MVVKGRGRGERDSCGEGKRDTSERQVMVKGRGRGERDSGGEGKRDISERDK